MAALSRARQMLLERAPGTLRRLPLAVSGALRRFGEDPARGRAAIERAIPGLRRAPSADLGALLDRAVANDRYDEAIDVLDGMREDDPRRPGAALAVAGLAGHLDQVIAAKPQDRRGRRAVLRARMSRERLSSALPDWCSSPWHSAAPAPVPTVVHVVTNSLPTVQAGSTIRTQRVARAQRDLGWDAHVVTRPGFPVTRGIAWSESTSHVDGVPYHHLLPMLMPADIDVPAVYARMLDAEIEVIRPTVLHAASDHVNARAALEVGRRRGLPVAYEVRSFFEDTWLSRHGADRSADTYRLLRDRHDEILHAADVITTLGEAMRAEIISRGVPADRVFVAPNAVPEAFVSRPVERHRPALGLDDEALWIGSLATLNADEGFDTSIRAAAVLRAAGRDVRVLLVGAGPAGDSLQRLARDLNVPLVLPGRVPVAQTLPWYDALDVFVYPRADTALNRVVTGLKPIEAQARRVPVIGSDLPAVREVLVPGSPLVPPGDSTALAAAIESLVPAERRADLGAMAHDWVSATRTWPRVMDAYRAAYSFGDISPD